MRTLLAVALAAETAVPAHREVMYSSNPLYRSTYTGNELSCFKPDGPKNASDAVEHLTHLY
jgi:hypothetical protein